MKENSAQEPPWGELSRIQAIVDGDRLSRRAGMHAIDEAYTEVMNEVVRHSAQSLQRRFWSLVANRGRKYRRRQEIEKHHAPDILPRRARDPHRVLERRELVSLIQAAVDPGDGALLWAIAKGSSYKELATVKRISVGTLKARVCRLRRRLRATIAKVA